MVSYERDCLCNIRCNMRDASKAYRTANNMDGINLSETGKTVPPVVNPSVKHAGQTQISS